MYRGSFAEKLFEVLFIIAVPGEPPRTTCSEKKRIWVSFFVCLIDVGVSDLIGQKVFRVDSCFLIVLFILQGVVPKINNRNIQKYFFDL